MNKVLIIAAFIFSMLVGGSTGCAKVMPAEKSVTGGSNAEEIPKEEPETKERKESAEAEKLEKSEEPEELETSYDKEIEEKKESAEAEKLEPQDNKETEKKNDRIEAEESEKKETKENAQPIQEYKKSSEETEKPGEIKKQEDTEKIGEIENTPPLGTEKPAQTENAEIPISDPVPIPPMPSENSSLVGYNDRKSWWFKRNSDHLPPSAQNDINISQYDAYYLGDTQSKVIYLTFDEGYENGYTEKILDVLKENNVKAAFFVTKTYIESCPQLVQRMVDEGHVVGNHSVTHRDFTTLSDKEIVEELEGCAEAFQALTGQQMPPFVRPPEGVYSIRTLEKTQQAGYKTIFWSFAYQDWDTKKQPGKQGAYDMVMNHYHNGSIMLLHAVSQSNTEALPDIIESLRQKGYLFQTLYELPKSL